MTMLKTLVLLAIINSAMAADYTVGAPSGGWDLTTDLTAWASSITFSPGDNLVFQYTPNHDVAEVSQADFDSCNPNSPLQPPFTNGSTTIPLSSAGSRYFICTIGNGGHCLGGMKVEIDTIADSAPPPAAPPTPAASTPPTTAPPKTPLQPPTTTPLAPSPPPAGGRAGPAPSPPPRATASGPTPPPAMRAPPPSGSTPPPAPSSVAKFNVRGGLATACYVFSVIMLSF